MLLLSLLRERSMTLCNAVVLLAGLLAAVMGQTIVAGERSSSRLFERLTCSLLATLPHQVLLQ